MPITPAKTSMNDAIAAIALGRRIDLTREADFVIGGVRIRPTACEIVAGGRRVRLQPRVMQVLVALARAGGEPVSREALTEVCWGQVRVGDDALNRCIQRLRRLAAAESNDAFTIETIPRVGYRLGGPGASTEGSLEPATGEEAPPPIASKPSIAVAPFANLSNDPEQEYFAEGMVAEIVGALSRFKSIFVLAAGSSVHFRGKVAGPQDAARQLGVGYLLEGNVRKAAGRVRISVNLIDTSNGAQIWTDRFEDTLEDVFALQDRVALRVAGVIEPTVQDVDTLRVSTRATDNMNSYDLYLRADKLFRSFTKDDTLLAIDLLDRAIALDPNYALALSLSGVCHRQVIDYAWSDDPEGCRRRGLELAEGALKVGGGDDRVLAHVAISLPGLEGSLDRAIALIERAMVLNPRSAFVWLISGVLHLREGAPDLASEHLETSIRLDPLSRASELSRMYMATALFQRGRFADALATFKTTTLRLPASHAIMAAAHGYLGETGAAWNELSRFRALSSAPIDGVAHNWFQSGELRKLFLDGIALAECADPSRAGAEAR